MHKTLKASEKASDFKPYIIYDPALPAPGKSMPPMSSESEPLQIPPDIARIAGPLVLGYLFNWALFGALSVQVYNYHVAFPKDRLMAKAAVYGVYLIELVQTIIVARDCFASFATGFGDFGALISMQTIWFSGPISIGLVGCIVQLYYAYRVYILSQSKILVGAIAACSLFQFSSAIAQGVQAYRINNLAVLADKAYLTLSMWLAGSAVCDIIITASMAFLLLRRDGQIPTTHTIIIRLVQLIVETGVLTATMATVDLILLLAFPKDNFHAAVTFTLAKLYSNSLLVLFNNRAQLQRELGGIHSLSLNTSILRSDNTRSGGAIGANGAVPAAEIHVQKMTFVAADDIPLEDRSTTKPRSLSLADSSTSTA